MRPRFFAPDASASAGPIVLPADEARHAARVMRLRAGDEIAVFNGAGHEWRARIVEASPAVVRVEVLEALAAPPEPRVHLALLQAVLKGDHMDAVARDATMMGVAAIVPVLTANIAANGAAASRPKARDRWQRVAIASAKQCRRAVVPEIRAAAPLAEVLASPALRADQHIVLTEPAAAESAVRRPLGSPSSAVLAVGPEGGWSPEELRAFAAAGFQPLTLGSLTFRADAAALVAIAALRAWWGDL